MKQCKLGWLVAAALVAAAAPLDAGWRAGFGRVDITPAEPMWLGGYADRKSPSTSTTGRIEVKALALEDEAGGRLVAVTCDLLTMPRDVAEPVAARLGARYALPRSRILLCASHSHSSPIIRDALIGMYPLDEPRLAQVDRYTETVKEALFTAACSALDGLAPAVLRAGSGTAGFAANRRKVTPQDPVDHRVPAIVVELRAAAGEKRLADRAVLFAYACHNTTLNGLEACGDYAGFAQEELEREHPGLLAIFASGCAGDQNPEPRRDMQLARKHGKELAGAVSKLLAGELRELRGITRAAIGWTDLPLVPAPSRAEVEARLGDSNIAAAHRARRLLAELDRHGRIAESYPYAAQVWRLGDDDAIVALAGEVVVEYSLRLDRDVRDAIGTRHVAVLAYANDCPAYIPSEKVLREGGYEGGGAMLYYGLHGPWAAGVEARIVRHVLEVARATSAPAALPPSRRDAARRLWSAGRFTEGPAIGANGVVHFSDIPNDRILAFDRGNVFEVTSSSGRANGLAFDSAGRLIACEGAAGGRRRVSLTEPGGEARTLAERFEGRRLNSPNDLAIDASGRVYFSDPRFAGDEPREIDAEAVYRIEADGSLSRVVADVVRPNGLAIGDGGRTLYVSDSGSRRLLAYRVSDEPPFALDRVVFDFGDGRGIDGMDLDSEGNILGAAGEGARTGIWTIAPSGTLLDFVPLPETATNCCLAGPRTLYATAGGSLYRIELGSPSPDSPGSGR